MAVQPRTPRSSYEKVFPDPVIEAWNAEIELLDKGLSFRIRQGDMILRLTKAMDCDRQTVFDEGWLDIETFYGKHGWIVEYDQPDWGESYEPIFTFHRKKPTRPG